MDFLQGVACPTAPSGLTSHLFMSLINTLITSQCLLGHQNQYPSDYGPYLQDGEEFDFIIVGSGSAGNILANRLSQNPNWRILLLEAGTYPSASTDIPFNFDMRGNTSDDWGYGIEPQRTACIGLKHKVCGCPRGKALGGSTSINGMIYIRGNRKDYDQWAELGNTGWDYDSVLKYFNRFEDLEGIKDERHGKGGELKLTYSANPHPIRKTLIQAYQELGFGEYSDENPIGYTDAYSTISNGTRFNTAKAFLSTTKERKNFHVAMDAQVAQVLMQKSTFAVEGVKVRVKDRLLTIRATKEVILSAGSINSPQILMNSGIGPEQHLKEVGIPIIKNLQVGENLQDHFSFTGLFYNIDQSQLNPVTNKTILDDYYQYLMNQKGPLARSGIENFLFFVDSHGGKYPTLEQYYIPIHQNDPYGMLATLQKTLNMPEEVIKAQNENNKKSHNVYLIPSIAYPKSIGKVLLRTADPFVKPKIFPNYLGDPKNEDLQIMFEGIRFYQKLIETKAFARQNPKLVHFDLVNCKQFVPDSDDYWKCALRNIGTNLYHPVGTCKMGPKSDPGAVVDSRLRVYGVKGLRVADASIMPKIISCNINAATIMIGEKAAEIIKQDWSKTRTEL